MKLSELIDQATRLFHDHGDLTVRFENDKICYGIFYNDVWDVPAVAPEDELQTGNAVIQSLKFYDCKHISIENGICIDCGGKENG